MSNIYKDLRNLQNEMIKIVGEFNDLTNSTMRVHNMSDNLWQPKCDVFSTDFEFYIIVDIAGVEKDSIKININEKHVIISGQRQFEINSKNICYYNMEIETGKFERKIPFPDSEIDKNNPTVNYYNGFLKIVFGIIPNEEKTIWINIE